MDCLGIMAREGNQLGKVNQARPAGRPRGGEAADGAGGAAGVSVVWEDGSSRWDDSGA